MATESRQATFGDVYIEQYDGKRKCEETVDKEYVRVRCSFRAKYRIVRKERVEYYCNCHTRESIKELAQINKDMDK